MSADSEPSTQINTNIGGKFENVRPTQRIDSSMNTQNIDVVAGLSQQSIPSTEVPASLVDLAPSSRTKLNDDRALSPQVIQSSLTPPPSSQAPPSINGVGLESHLDCNPSLRSGIISPPETGLLPSRRDRFLDSEYTPPGPEDIEKASADELRTLFQEVSAECAKLKVEAAHHSFNHSLQSLAAKEEANRFEVELDMTRREVEALRAADHVREARRELSAEISATQAKYLQLKAQFDKVVAENTNLHLRLKAAKRIVLENEEDMERLKSDNDELVRRVRDNREHMQIYTSPGGILYPFVGPAKESFISTHAQHRAPHKQASRSTHRDQPINFLLQAVDQEKNNSAPSTPITGRHPLSQAPAKHTRNVQSMPSLPSTPQPRFYGDCGVLLPSVDLIAQTEPAYRSECRYLPDAAAARRRSRDSTISVDDNRELARQALAASAAAAAAAASSASRGSQCATIPSQPRLQRAGDAAEDEKTFQSHASQVASEMLRRNSHESFEMASSWGDLRDGTPQPAAEKSAKLQAKLFAGLGQTGFAGGLAAGDKRKYSSSEMGEVDMRELMTSSPTKKLRTMGGLRDPGPGSLGALAIQYPHGQDS